MKKKAYVIDIETLSNMFLLCIVDIKSKEIRRFCVHELRNDWEELIEFLKEKSTHISYNGIDFDAQVLQWLWDNHRDLEEYEPEYIARAIYTRAQEVIEISNSKEFQDYRESDFRWEQVDLYKIWHFNNRAKATSLKWVQFMIDWHDVREMPVHHATEIRTEEEIDQIISYCDNDILSTLEFFKISRGKTDLPEYKGKDKIDFRLSLKKKMGFECMNWNDVRIGDELNFRNYTQKTEETKGEIKARVRVRDHIDLKECVPSYISFKTEQLQTLLSKIKNTTVPVPFNKDGFTFDHIITFGRTQHQMKLGGLHSKEGPRIIKPTSKQILRDADVGGQYPGKLWRDKIHPRHLSSFWSDQIGDNIVQRAGLKKIAKTDKLAAAFAEALKLASNGGGFGKLGEETNWQHDYQAMLQVTIGCQLELLMLIEELEMNGITVVSSNTDGIVSLFDKDLESLYQEICERWEKRINISEYGRLEYSDYSLLIQTAVNDYIAVKTDGSVKKKGDFMTEFEIHKDKSARIVPLALEAYFVRGVNPKMFIRTHSNIFDFCIAVKAKGGFYYEARSFVEGEYKVEKLQKLVRHYISNKGVKLIKCHPDGREMQCEAGKWISTVFNRFEKREDYDVNYDYYIASTYDIINKIQPEVTRDYTQLSIF